MATSLVSGAVVSKVDYVEGDDPTRTDYTLVRAGGKLTKHTRQTRTLASVDKIRLSTWVGDATGLYTGAESNSQYVMYWDDQAGAFKVVGRMVCGNNSCTTQDLAAEQSVSPAFWSAQGGVRGWSEVLGGDVFIDLRSSGDTVDSSTVNVIYRTQDIVYPADMPATLYCLRDCPSAATLAGYFSPGAGTESPFEPESFNQFGPTATAFTYATDAATAMLTDALGSPVVYTDREAMQHSQNYAWGVRTGRLFSNIAGAQCPDDLSRYCESQIDALDVYHEWETGADAWNQFAAVKDSSGTFVTFDAPLQLNYAVPSGAAYGDYAGKTIVLQYGGFGSLWGIPGYCVSSLTNEPVSCGIEGAREVSAFMIPMDESTGRVTAGDATYLVKWLNREIRFAVKPSGACASLLLPDSIELPTAAGLVDPSDAQSPIYIGTKPVLTSAPRVIHGEPDRKPGALSCLPGHPRQASRSFCLRVRQERRAHPPGPDRIAITRHVQIVRRKQIPRLAVCEHRRGDVDVLQVRALCSELADRGIDLALLRELPES